MHKQISSQNANNNPSDLQVLNIFSGLPSYGLISPILCRCVLVQMYSIIGQHNSTLTFRNLILKILQVGYREI